jgi:hypothetical protein
MLIYFIGFLILPLQIKRNSLKLIVAHPTFKEVPFIALKDLM